MLYFVILTRGEYSDRERTYFVGEKRKIEEDELTGKSNTVRHELNNWYEKLPERQGSNVIQGMGAVFEKYNPDTGASVTRSDLIDYWFNKMTQWLEDNGFAKVPEDTPEAKVDYDI